MVSIDPESRKKSSGGGITIPFKYAALLALFVIVLSVSHVKTFLIRRSETGEVVHTAPYLESKPVLRNPTHIQEQCKLYLAESIMAEKAGLGIFTGIGLMPGETVGVPDICIFVGDAPQKKTHIRSHTFGWMTFFGQHEGGNSRAACEGIPTIFNTNGVTHVNTKLVSPVQATTAGVRRNTSPGAGSITHHFGIHGETLDTVPAGQELTIWYGDWDDFFEGKDLGPRPGREVDWLDKNGWCIDHVEIRQSTIHGAGRGAFMKRHIAEGDVVLPAPLQVFDNRELFQNTEPEQLYINYCLQPESSNMIFFPYGPAVGTINHSKKLANVRYQWSSHPLHRADLLDMNYRLFWQNVYPGALILEVVALRDLRPGEELFMDYGDAWEAAYQKHVEDWVPYEGEYVYPEDMDDTAPLRTVLEQETEPYPKNLITMCATPDHSRKKQSHIEWHDPNGEWGNSEYMVYCHILERKLSANGDFVYDVSLLFLGGKNEAFRPEEYEFDPTALREHLYIDYNVPRHAIRWAEKPYLDDEHLPGVFRHPIVFDAELVPEAWKTVV